MRILSVPTKSLMHVPFVDLKVFSLSIRQLLYFVAGLIFAFKALTGDMILTPLFLLFLTLAFFPYKFLAPEMHLIHAISYKIKKSHHTTRKKSALSSELLYAGSESTLKHVEGKTDGNDTEKIIVDDLDTPYTLSLHTNEKKQFVPVQVEIDGKIIVNTSTARHGKVSCTIMIESLGTKEIRVLKTDDGTVLYGRSVIFER